jgi:hypothetical protein
VLDIPLDSYAIADINAAKGGDFSIGATADQTTPEPGTLWLMLIACAVFGSCLLAVNLYRRRAGSRHLS